MNLTSRACPKKISSIHALLAKEMALGACSHPTAKQQPRDSLAPPRVLDTGGYTTAYKIYAD